MFLCRKLNNDYINYKFRIEYYAAKECIYENIYFVVDNVLALYSIPEKYLVCNIEEYIYDK